MLERLKTAKKVVGTRGLLKAIAAGKVAQAFIALDCDLFIYKQVSDACKQANIPLTEVDAMAKLGEACGVQVKTASAGILKDA